MAPQLNQEDWNRFILAAPYTTFLHSWEWGQFQEELGVPYWRIVIEEEGVIACVALVVKRALPWGRSWLYLPRGPVFAANLNAAAKQRVWQRLEARLQELAAQEHALFVRLDPAWPTSSAAELVALGWSKAEREVQPRDTIIVDITKSEEELLGAMHPKTRYNIKVAQKHGVSVTFARDSASVETFLTLAREVSNRSQFNFHPDAYYRAMRTALAPVGFEVALATHQATPLAVHLLVTFGGTVAYAHGASASAQRQLMAPHLLQWESIRRAHATGKTRYDFFGVAPADAPATHSWRGITRFKEGFGGQRESYVGTHDLVLDRVGYAGFTVARRLRKLWR